MKAKVPDSQIISAGRSLQEEGKPVNGWSLRNLDCAFVLSRYTFQSDGKMIDLDALLPGLDLV